MSASPPTCTRPEGGASGKAQHPAADAALPYAGLKVIDCASYIAGPACATLLGDLGADVVKLEPLEGDPHRSLYQLPGTPPADANYPWILDSRNKRSLALDLKRPEARAVLHRLVAQADVFITNLPLLARERLGIAAEQLLPLNDRLIYASMTAYGETGPEANKNGFDVTAYWARSGLMDLVRSDANAPPTRPVAGLGDHPSAVTLMAAVATALYRRERTGRGGQVATSLLANGLWSNAIQVQAQLTGVSYAPRPPRSHAPNALNNIYQCRCGRWLNLVALNESRQLRPLLTALGLAELADDPRFASAPARAANHDVLIALIDARFAEHDLPNWRQRLDAVGITFGVIGTLADIDNDAQMQASGALRPRADGGGLTVASPVQLAGVAQRAPGPAPALGEHSAGVLAEAGYTDTEIDHLFSIGVVSAASARPSS